MKVFGWLFGVVKRGRGSVGKKRKEGVKREIRRRREKSKRGCKRESAEGNKKKGKPCGALEEVLVFVVLVSFNSSLEDIFISCEDDLCL